LYTDWDTFKTDYIKLVESAFPDSEHQKDEKWTKSIAVGDSDFVATIRNQLGIKVKKRSILKNDLQDTYILKEPKPDYHSDLETMHDSTDEDNLLFWNDDEISEQKSL
jgi:hypothetical protein